MKKSLILITLLLNILLLSSFVSAGWLTGRYSGNVVIVGEFTEESCNTSCGADGGTIDYAGDKNCACNPKEVLRTGRAYCTDYKNQKVCGELGKKVTANDGVQFTFTKERNGLFRAAKILVNIKEPFKELPKY